jgi:hypothetical protein
MWSFLGGLVKGFLLLRDFFGYVIPGAVLWAIVAYSSGAEDLSQLPLNAGHHVAGKPDAQSKPAGGTAAPSMTGGA